MREFNEQENCRTCGGDAQKNILIEYLYLDLNACDRCIGTDQVLDEVVEALIPVLRLAGYAVAYRKAEITTAEIAEQYRFLSSPTVRVNGHDVCRSVKENRCGCCSEISGTDVDCRVFEYNGEISEVPSKEMLTKAILQAVFGKHEKCDCDYRLPENLKAFFEGKNSKSSCTCGGNC